MGELQSAERVFLDAFGPAIEPRIVIGFDEWLPKNIVLIDGPMAGKLWSAPGAPYLVEIASCLSEDHPCNRVSIRKSQQSGCSILGMAWALYIADIMPANTLYALPGLEARRDISSRKLGPLIRAWEKHIGRTVFATQKDRSGDGSTTHEKRFGDSFLGLANANSKMDLSANTCRFGIKDELPKWKRLQTGENPETLFDGRFTAFQRTRDWKHLEFGTPEVDTGDDAGLAEGHCRIDRAFKASDRRFWHVGCPECHPATGALFYFRPEGFKVDYEHPHRSTYTCPHCGHAVSESERVDMIPAGTWIPTGAIGNGRHRGYHVDGFMSLMMSLEVMADKAITAERGTEKDRKDYSTLECGLPYRFKGDAPDYKKLYARREKLTRYHVPAGGLLLVASADVQLRGIWLEILAIGADRQSWVVDATYLPGDTSSPSNEVFEDLLAHTVDRTFPDAFGRPRTVDALAIDTGYRAHVVYAFARVKQRAHPHTGKRVIVTIKGMPGWGKPAIGQPKPMTVDLDGKKIPQGALLWEVGTWSLKAGLYTDLAKLGVQHEPELKQDPPGLCHFGLWQDEAYFKQLTAEHLEDIIVRGVVTERVWKKAADNHYLDCRVYNMALAEYLGLGTMTADQWAELARLRGLPDELTTPDLFTPTRRSAATSSPSDGGEGEPAAGAAASSAAPAADDPWAALAQLNAY